MKNCNSVCLPALCALLLAFACDDSRPGTDAGAPPPSGLDAGPTGVDAGPPAPGVDSGPIPQIDAGGSGTFDAGPAGTDAGGSTGADGGGGGSVSGGDPRAGYVGCGMTSCMAPQVCCVSLSGATCGAMASCSGGFSAPGTCDGPEDCSGNACCVHFGMFDPNNGAFCRAGGCPSGDNELCHGDSDCTGGARCVACQPPTGGILDVTYGICSRDGRCPSPYTMAP
ncbi:MAG: hypothetical protein KF729_18860 [Sandaracinaceae bacterium]|nr:hypothetical protein [Sandaracinaceae bacterium]